MTNVHWLEQINQQQLDFVGIQAFNLSQLLQKGYPVLPGFVVPASAFWELIESLGKSEPLFADLPDSSFHLDVDNYQQLRDVAQRMRQVIIGASPAQWESLSANWSSETLIMRPSIALSLPKLSYKRQGLLFNLQEYPHSLGILDSQICFQSPEAMLMGLKRVWAEAFRARSLFYWKRAGIEIKELNLAVLVQPLENAIASGTIIANSDELQIQATWGLGIAITKGEVLPDSYVVQQTSGMIKTSRLGSKNRAYRIQSLSNQVTPETASALQGYILSEEQQQQYALEEIYLQQLIELCQQISSDFSSTFTIEWTLCQTPSTQPQFYLTHFMPELSSKQLRENLSSIVLKGLAAASGKATAQAQVILGDKSLETMLPGRILVAKSIVPDWLPWLKQAAAIVTEQGGMTSHGAIIARELGIPAVVNVAGATQLMQMGEFLVVDGDRGEIKRLGSQDANLDNQIVQSIEPQATAQSFYPIATQLLVNLSLASSLAKVVDLPVDGVGLLRSELMMLELLENRHPSTWLQQGKREFVERLVAGIVQIAAAFAPRPVFYRSLDWRSSEFSAITSNPEVEVNPMLGWRGTLRYLSDPTYFDLELQALRQVQSEGYTNLRLVLPFVRTVEEFSFCRRRVEQAGLSDNSQFQLWIMAEVPSVLFLLPDYVKAGVQGISIGTNDLTQLLLAIDRDQGNLGTGFDGRHPAVLSAIKQLITMAKKENIPCSICGQATAQYPELIDLLVQWGITSISVDGSDLKRTYSLIARAEQRLLLAAARRNIKD